MLDTFRTVTKTLAAVELATLTVMVEENPDNLYWQERLDEFKREINPAVEAYQMEHETEESTADEWLSYLDTNLDPRTPEQRDLDEWQAEASDVGYGKNGRPR